MTNQIRNEKKVAWLCGVAGTACAMVQNGEIRWPWRNHPDVDDWISARCMALPQWK
jgi:hypothetical protein